MWPWMSLSPSLSYRFPKPPSKEVKLINSKLSSGFGVCDVSSAVYDLRAATRREETDVSLQMGASVRTAVSFGGRNPIHRGLSKNKKRGREKCIRSEKSGVI